MSRRRERDALPDRICFRVTRVCNARCVFCLAPPDGLGHPLGTVLRERIDWVLARGVRTVHFCGGEPTLHPDLEHLIEHVRARRARVELTTNAIAVPRSLPAVLDRARAPVKVSIHGDRARHDALVGRPAYDATLTGLRALLAAGVRTTVQTTVVAGGESVLDEVSRLCLSLGVRRLSLLPFLPRGFGAARRDSLELDRTERSALRARAARLRREHAGRLDVRWLDFTARPIHVVEPDGRIVLEGASEASDRLVARIPSAPDHCRQKSASPTTSGAGID